MVTKIPPLWMTFVPASVIVWFRLAPLVVLRLTKRRLLVVELAAGEFDERVTDVLLPAAQASLV